MADFAVCVASPQKYPVLDTELVDGVYCVQVAQEDDKSETEEE